MFAGYDPGDYTVVVRNGDGCVSSPVTATIDPAPNTPADATVAYIQPTCTVATGTITVTAQTGNGIEYSIDNGVTYQASNVFAGYDPGDYTVMVRNGDGCVSSPVTATIDDVPTIPTPQFQITPLGCNDTTGTIEVTGPLGPEYTYRIDTGAYQASTTFAGYDPGNYTITARNTDGCTSTVTATINPAPAIPADADVSFTQPNCNNQFGSITINSPIGQGLTYSINNGNTYQSITNYTGLPAGNYNILVKNAAGCVSANPQTVTINAAPPVPNAAGYVRTNPTCANPFGSITITSPIGANLEYSIDNGNSYDTNLVHNNLTPGLYQIVVRNTIGGCISSTVNVTINPAPNLPDDAVVNVNQPGCNNSTGSITIQSPLGAGYMYSIDGVTYQPLTTFYGIAPGNHFAYVRNAAGCISGNPTPFTINNPPSVPVPATVTVTNPTCTTATGTLEVTNPLGADLTYTIDGINYQTSPIFTDLDPGSYTIRTQNAAGCISLPVTRIIQSQPATPEVPTYVVTQPDCFTDTGRIVVTSPIGIGHTYSINGGINYQGTTTFTNIAPGDYIITVRNSAGCTEVSDTITIDNPPAPAPNPGVITGNSTICEGETTQLANVVLDGVWSSSNENIATVDETGFVTSLLAGTVTISYTVGTECTDAATMTVRINPLPKPDLEDIYYICQNLETEEYNNVMLNTGLSNGNHSFVWTKDGTVLPYISGFIIADEPGEYSVEATNLNTGCIGVATTTVAVSSIAVATAEVATDFQYNQTITINVIGGSGDYEFSLNGGAFQDENVFTNITEGLYTITVNDKNGCDPLVLEVYALNYPRFFSPNGDGQHETWNIKGLSGQKDAVIYIYDRYGKVISVIRPGQVGWDGTYNGERLPATDYWFKLLYRSSNGTDKEFKAHFSLLR
ncbi:T9SS type B sorting domain-containing protein [Flavobacterium sp. SaA2.13]|uniref:T9SS type B sorting domain-containing protein n=1 Tax=Flavobacterium sp. SaA2.13 TaxID=2691898 RepID=UPI00178C43A0|nr:T9SS type B sorting domain-containing protein [Flavobacterium sp. SaA2.13]